MIIPSKPRLAIRIGFAGARAVADVAVLVDRLDAVYKYIAEVVAAAALAASGSYATDAPVVRLTTGLAEGGDLTAANSFLTCAADRMASPAITRQLAAVLPFDRATFRSHLEAASQPLFDGALVRCEGRVLELDGRYLADDSPPNGKTASFCRHVRTRAYRGQAAVLLRQCDLLLAAYDPAAIPKPGGTVETIRQALELAIPVVVIPLGEESRPDNVAILRQRDGFHEHHPMTTPAWREELAEMLRRLIIPPSVPADGDRPAHEPRTQRPNSRMELLRDYYGTGPRLTRLTGLRQIGWTCFEERFNKSASTANPTALATAPASAHASAPALDASPAAETSPAAPALPNVPDPFKAYRDRAAILARYYNGIYRGTFFMNYVLAVVAICIAVVGLRLLLSGHWWYWRWRRSN